MSTIRRGTITQVGPPFRMLQDGATQDMLVSHIVGSIPVVDERVAWTLVDGMVIVLGHSPKASWKQTFHDNRPILSPVTGHSRAYNAEGEDLNIIDITVSLDVAPLGSDFVYDVKRNGTSLWADPTDLPIVPKDAEVWSADLPDDVLLVDGDYLTIDIVQVGSSTAGGYLVVQVSAQGVGGG